MTFEDLVKAGTNDKNDTYQKNFRTLKFVVEAVLFCSKQEIPFWGHWEPANNNETLDGKRINKGNFLAIINAFGKLDPILRNHLENVPKKQKSHAGKFKMIGGRCSECYALIANKVTDRFSNKEIWLLCLCFVTFQNDLPRIHVTFFDFLHFDGGPTGKTMVTAYYP